MYDKYKITVNKINSSFCRGVIFMKHIIYKIFNKSPIVNLKLTQTLPKLYICKSVIPDN